MTDNGTVYHGYFKKNKSKLAKQPTDTKMGLSKSPSTSSFTLEDIAEDLRRKKEDQEEIMIERIGLLYRGIRVSSDNKSRTFAVIQSDPRLGQVISFILLS